MLYGVETTLACSDRTAWPPVLQIQPLNAHYLAALADWSLETPPPPSMGMSLGPWPHPWNPSLGPTFQAYYLPKFSEAPGATGSSSF
jgi:hypothetical protein